MQSKLRWRAKFPESTARETGHLIAMVLTMQLDQQAPRARQIVLHWRRRNQQRCQEVVLNSSEGSFQDPWILAIANLLRQILN
jgi:hypothetical protein